MGPIMSISTELTVLRRVLRHARPNVLIIGSWRWIEAVRQTLTPLVALPICLCLLPGPLTLARGPVGTLLVEDVAALRIDQQTDLLQWLGRDHRVQVISATSTPLFPLVRRGTFSEMLYYRLNMLTIDE
jgi:hypothetical protein